MKNLAPTSKPLVSASILLWHSEKFISGCLESLFAQTYKNFELIITDNNDVPDDGVRIAQEFLEKQKGQYPVKFTSNGRNLGFAAGHNRNIEQGRGKYVLLLNQDIVLAPNFLEKAVAFLEGQPNACGVQSRCLRLKEKDGRFEKSQIIDSLGLVMLKNRRIIGRRQGQSAENYGLKQREIFGLDGAVPVFRREALEEAKICLDGRCEYLDEDFLSYKEDVDLAWRFRLLGWRAFYVPEVVAWHARGSGDSAKKGPVGIVKERLKISDFAKKLSFRNQRLMQLKNELPLLFFCHLPWLLLKEVPAWLYFLVFEWRNREAIGGIFKLMPRMWRKRKIIMGKRKAGFWQMARWFE
ncbi:MAG: hypothetical protein COU85_02590 [Candidatus Portnoybacteria bacterium CG10_big_fil_rev_8_21_14_0_10_44_7]|uniref:Glycosyltransferase 2-like domain-containing protein n=1 Tax=Candidatus Portnoybacteria bacterium CG10_big_fil_rev_8_21_14_0_10_44_7 TaxID=1974816 RepID=A0A2M8KI95_9BACT|nr:MAG: hypothetical protein COU85_02590 [Candidatus Portnoybacteria bacterium CG10_big_fil_rev_8_21_14_0_10_44_7]